MEPLPAAAGSAPNSTAPGPGVRRFLLALALLWSLLESFYVSFPYIRNGSDVVLAAKREAIDSRRLFDPSAAVRLAFFGNSKILAGFRPADFDAASSGTVAAYNLGLPATIDYLPGLKKLCDRHEAPTHVLLAQWPEHRQEDGSLARVIGSDEQVMHRLFPFRSLPRDGFIFLVRAHQVDGIRSLYRFSEQQLSTLFADDGYYFIQGESHFAGNRLPDGFRVDSDDEHLPWARLPLPDAPDFATLEALARSCGFVVGVVPAYWRQGEFAKPPPFDHRSATALAAHPVFRVFGPPYVLYPNRLFSDLMHLNPEGAAAYTSYVWSLVHDWLTVAKSDNSTAGARPREQVGDAL